MDISMMDALMRSSLFASAASLCLMLSACGHGRVSAEEQVQSDDVATSSQPAASPPPEAAQDQSASGEAERRGVSGESADALGVPVSEPTASESNQAMLGRVVSQHCHKLRSCYERALQQNPEMQELVLVKISLAQTGEVEAATISASSIKDEAIEDCIVRTVLTWRFEEPEGGAWVTHSLFLLQGSPAASQPVLLGSTPAPPRQRRSFDKEIVRLIVRKHRDEIRSCYERELQKNPKLAGQVTAKFTISGTGSVSDAIIRASTLEHAEVEACIINNLLTWQFPPPKGGGIVVISYPFNFSP